MSARRRAKQERRAERKRRERLRLLAAARARADGCTCPPRVSLVELAIGPAVYVQHRRGCPRWEAIRAHGDVLVTGTLHAPPVDGGAA
jgi:hypothetical protein